MSTEEIFGALTNVPVAGWPCDLVIEKVRDGLVVDALGYPVKKNDVVMNLTGIDSRGLRSNPSLVAETARLSFEFGDRPKVSDILQKPDFKSDYYILTSDEDCSYESFLEAKSYISFGGIAEHMKMFGWFGANNIAYYLDYINGLAPMRSGVSHVRHDVEHSVHSLLSACRGMDHFSVSPIGYAHYKLMSNNTRNHGSRFLVTFMGILDDGT